MQASRLPILKKVVGWGRCLFNFRGNHCENNVGAMQMIKVRGNDNYGTSLGSMGASKLYYHNSPRSGHDFLPSYFGVSSADDGESSHGATASPYCALAAAKSRRSSSVHSSLSSTTPSMS